MTIHKDGVCPVCHSTLVDFGCAEFDDTCVIYPATCMDCGAEFSSVYSTHFEGHENIVHPQPEQTYEVFVSKVVTVKVEVKAHDKDEAVEKAFNIADFNGKEANFSATAQLKGDR